MRILFVGNVQSTSTSIYYYHSLIKLGHEVIPMDLSTLDSRDIWSRIQLKLTKSTPKKTQQYIHSAILNCLRMDPADLVFVMAQNFLTPELLAEMRQANRIPLTLIYHSHDNNFSKGIGTPGFFWNSLKMYDLVFTTKSQNVDRYKEIGIESAHFIPSAFEPAIHHPIPNDRSRFKTNFPVTFVGTYDRSRDEPMSKAGWDRSFVWGNHWEKYSLYNLYRSRITPNAIYRTEYSDILSHSEIVLGLLREEAEDLHTQRTFEIPACGSLQVAPFTEEVANFFQPEKEIILYRSNEEMKEKIDFLLKKPSLRLQIRNAGHQRAIKGKHTYLDRTEQILQKVNVL